MGKSRLLLLVLGLAACGSPSSDSGVRTTDSAGVTLVTSPGTDRPYPFTVTLQRRLGLDDDGVAAITQLSGANAGVDGEDRIYILDTPLLHVKVLDTMGALLAIRGREGMGPGEFSFPARLTVDPDGSVAVTDYAKSALVRFAPDGTPGPEYSYQPLGFPFSGLHLDDSAVYMDTFEPAGSTSIVTLRRLTPTDTAIVTRLVNPAIPGMVRFTCVGLSGQAPILSPSLVWSARDSFVVAAAEAGFRVDLFAHGRLLRSIRREVTPIPATAAEAHRLLPEGRRIGFGRPGGADGCTIPTEEMIEKLGVAPVVPEIQGLVLAPDGTLWVQRYTFPDEPQRVDVFDPSGVYLGTITGHGVPAGFLSGNRVLFPIKDEETGGYSLGLFVLEPDGEPS